MAGYEDSALYKLSKQMAVEIHKLTLDELPKFEMYEQGSQIRRSSKSIVANFVEGYGRWRYKAEYIKFLIYALASMPRHLCPGIYAPASCDETKVHLELLHETHSLQAAQFEHFYTNYRKIGAMIYNLRQSIINGKAT